VLSNKPKYLKDSSKRGALYLNPLMHSITILAILSIIMVGCKPISKVGIKNVHVEAITAGNFKELNGTYSNNFDTLAGKIIHYSYDALNDTQRVTILSQLFLNFPETAWRDENGKMINPKEKWIKIEFQSKNQAIISMYHNDKFIFAKNIHGRVKKGYFYLRPKPIIVPLFPLIFGYNFKKVRIGKVENNLIIDCTLNRWLFAIFAGSSDRWFASSIYKKRNN
jgi:hypothetical protein